MKDKFNHIVDIGRHEVPDTHDLEQRIIVQTSQTKQNVVARVSVVTQFKNYIQNNIFSIPPLNLRLAVAIPVLCIGVISVVALVPLIPSVNLDNNQQRIYSDERTSQYTVNNNALWQELMQYEDVLMLAGFVADS